MKTTKQTSAALIAATLMLSASVANAGNITVSDNNFGSNGYIETAAGWYKGGALYAATIGATPQLSEYQEVEPGMATGSDWDLAAFVTPTVGRLGVVSAYDLQNGFGVPHTSIGDIFVSVNPSSLIGYNDPNAPYNQFAPNSSFNYDFAIRLNFGLGTYSVFQLSSSTILENGEYSTGLLGGNSNSASQPWRVANTNNLAAITIAGGALTYTNSQTAAAAGALTGYTVTSAYKYYAEVGTSWLNPFVSTTSPIALYKLTMECGNDNMIGIQNTGFNTVPDGSATLALLGMSFLSLVGIVNIRNRRR